jgi:hypothetical protein
VTPHVERGRKWVDWHGAMELAPIVSGITPALGDVLANGPAVVAPTQFSRHDFADIAPTIPLALTLHVA